MWRALSLFFICGVVAFSSGCGADGVSHPVNLRATTMPITVSDGGATAAYKKTLGILNEQIQIQAVNEPFEKVLNELCVNSQLPMMVNWSVLQAAGIEQVTPVTVGLVHGTRQTILEQVLSHVGGGSANLDYSIDDIGVVVVSTRDDLNSAKYRFIRVYDLGFLLDAVDPADSSGFLYVEVPVQATGMYPDPRDIPPGYEMAYEIIRLIENKVAPDSWLDTGGYGSIQYFKGVLAVNQSEGNHRKIAALLAEIKSQTEMKVRVYDVRDLVGNDDKKLRQLMDLMEGVSARELWVERGGRMGTMRGMGGNIYVSGRNHVHEQVESLLKVIREAHAGDRKMNVITPALSPVPPQTKRQPAPGPATQPIFLRSGGG